MQSINYHGKITKRRLEKCKDICRTWCDLQYRYAEILNNTDSVINFETNVPILDSLTSDFTNRQMQIAVIISILFQ